MGTSQAARQLTCATAPTMGMPAIQATGMPAIAHASTPGRCSAAGHSPAAAMPTATSRPMPIPATPWAAASTTKVGAAALSADPAATSAAPAPRRSRRPGRRGARASRTAVTPPVRPDSERSWPAVAVDTPRSCATSGRTGERTSIAAWDTKRQRKSVGLGRVRRRIGRGGEPTAATGR